MVPATRTPLRQPLLQFCCWHLVGGMHFCRTYASYPISSWWKRHGPTQNHFQSARDADGRGMAGEWLSICSGLGWLPLFKIICSFTLGTYQAAWLCPSRSISKDTPTRFVYSRKCWHSELIEQMLDLWTPKTCWSKRGKSICITHHHFILKPLFVRYKALHHPYFSALPFPTFPAKLPKCSTQLSARPLDEVDGNVELNSTGPGVKARNATLKRKLTSPDSGEGKGRSIARRLDFSRHTPGS